MRVQISQNASSPPPQGMSSLGMRGEGESRVKDEQFYEFFPDEPPCSVAMRKVKKRRRLLACCRSQATAITGHSPASSCSWGKGCPPTTTPLGMRTSPPSTQPLLTVCISTSKYFFWTGIFGSKTLQRKEIRRTVREALKKLVKSRKKSLIGAGARGVGGVRSPNFYRTQVRS